MPSSTRNDTTPASSVAAKVCYDVGRKRLKDRDYLQAIAFFEQCLSLQPAHFPALSDLAEALLTTSRIQPALTAYRKALRLSPDNPGILNGLGNCYRAEGDFGKAIMYYERALKANPDSVEAMYNLTLLHQYRLYAPLLKQLRNLYDSTSCTGQSRALVCFALARTYESHADLPRAFQYYAEANAVQFPLAGYDEARSAALFDEIEARFTAELFRRRGQVGRPDATPIFVLGMPRSGTSLVEQILASHSEVYGVGETSILPWIAESYIPRTYGTPFPSAVADMTTSAFASIADLYLERLSEYCPSQTTRIVDKTPTNVFLIGLIRLLYPHASIIHCARNPMDTCWSMFRQYFGSAHGYCYDQRALGRHYRRYQRLMNHWHNVLPGEIHDVEYEEMVTDPEKAIRALLEYCGLPWEDKCLAFYRTKRMVNTASATQVRRPVYKTSIHSWLPVAEELAPLRAALEDGGAGLPGKQGEI